MLMSAGLGTRLLPFTQETPKALIPLMGVPISQFAFDQLEAAWIKKIVINLHHLASEAKSSFNVLDRRDIQLKFSDESDVLLGSAGGIAHALHDLRGGAFFLMNADVLQDVDLVALAAAHQENRLKYGAQMTLALTTRLKSNEVYREILSDSCGRITGYASKKQGVPFYTGVCVLEPEVLEHIHPDQPSEFVSEILEPAIKRRTAFAFQHSGLWMDLGSPQLWLDAHLELMKYLDTNQAATGISRRVNEFSKCIRPGVWVNRSVQGLPEGEFSDFYLGNNFFKGTEAVRAVWYGDSNCSQPEQKRDWIACGKQLFHLSR